MTMKAALDFKNAAQYLDMTSDALRDLVKHHRIPYKKRGTTLIFLVVDLEAWLRALPGPNADDITPRHPAHLPDTPDPQGHDSAPADTETPPAIPFRRGRKRQIAVPEVRTHGR